MTDCHGKSNPNLLVYALPYCGNEKLGEIYSQQTADLWTRRTIAWEKNMVCGMRPDWLIKLGGDARAEFDLVKRNGGQPLAAEYEGAKDKVWYAEKLEQIWRECQKCTREKVWIQDSWAPSDRSMHTSSDSSPIPEPSDSDENDDKENGVDCEQLWPVWHERWNIAPLYLKRQWQSVTLLYNYCRTHTSEYDDASLSRAMESSQAKLVDVKQKLEEYYASHGDEVAHQARELAENPDARFPDEEPEEAENKADGPARELQEYLEEHQEQLGSQHYVKLCDISCAFAKLERRATRMRNKLLEYDGSDCSALIPSDDEHIDEADYASSVSHDSDDSGMSMHSDSGVKSSRASTASSAVGGEIANETVSEEMHGLDPSGYFVRYRGTYYCIPKRAIVRNYKRPISIPDEEAFKARHKRGGRAKAWEFDPICPASIVVVEMKNRNGINEFYWCVSLKALETSNADDAKILCVLPETTVLRLHSAIASDPTMRTSTLLSRFKPSWCDGLRTGIRQVPIPGPSRRSAVEQHRATGHTTGNYWPRLRNSKRLRVSGVETRSSAIRRRVAVLDSDDE